MTPNRPICSLSTLGTVLVVSVVVATGDGAPPALRPGVLGGGVTLLPNGWKIAPAGRHLQVGDLPLAMVESPDGRTLLVSSNGYAKPAVVLVDLERGYVSGSVSLDHAWLGMAWHPDGRRLYVSGAGNTTVHELQFAAGKLTRGADLVLGRQMEEPRSAADHPEAIPQSFIGGLAISPDGARLFAAHVLGQIVSAVDLKTGYVRRSVDLPAEPYAVLVSPDGSTVFVSLWGGARILLFDARTLETRGTVAVGEHPNAMAISKDGARLYVACANTNAVWAIDVAERRAIEQISIALFPESPPGSTPNSVSLSPDGTRLLVANADNNTVAVVDVSKPGASRVEGFIPTGWYPTAAMFSRDGSRVFVLSGKGLTSQANPRLRRHSVSNGDAQYVGAMLTGTLSILPTPDRAALEQLTRSVYAVTPYSDEHRLAPDEAPVGSPIPRRVGDPAPIKHVFYVIRENRSYDQVFGDLERGAGDPTLCLFGNDVTPNAHALVREFGILDNFYVDAEVSYDGHAFSTSAYATDVVEKFWPTNYASRGAAYLSEGGGVFRNGYGNLAAPLNGYLWDACARKGVSVRSFGEFAHWEAGSETDRAAGKVKVAASVPGLEGRVSADYPAWDLHVPDSRRADVWLQEFRDLLAHDRLPALSIIRLGGDHTFGTEAGERTPRAMVADNDLALGRIVETISRSAVWKDSAVFVLEDDAQDGPDHIDAHRSPALVISPFSKRRSVDSTLYTTSAMLRTIELVLGLPPMSQYDAAVRPMYAAFQPTPVLAPFVHLEAHISLDERNDPKAWGAAESARLDFDEADRVPARLFNEIIWRSVKGAESPMPPIVRTAWVRRVPSVTGDADEDER